MNQLSAIKVYRLPVYCQKIHILDHFLIMPEKTGAMFIFCDNSVMGCCPVIKHSTIVFSLQFNSNRAIEQL